MGRTCGEPNEIKKNTDRKHITSLVREQELETEHEAGAVVTEVRAYCLLIDRRAPCGP